MDGTSLRLPTCAIRHPALISCTGSGRRVDDVDAGAGNVPCLWSPAIWHTHGTRMHQCIGTHRHRRRQGTRGWAQVPCLHRDVGIQPVDLKTAWHFERRALMQKKKAIGDILNSCLINGQKSLVVLKLAVADNHCNVILWKVGLKYENIYL